MEPFKEKKNILDVETVKDTLSSSIVKPLTVQKKPVKFTWEGAANLMISLSQTPLADINQQRLLNKRTLSVVDLAKGRKKPVEKDYIDFLRIWKSLYLVLHKI